jgi:hypothetical protein
MMALPESGFTEFQKVFNGPIKWDRELKQFTEVIDMRLFGQVCTLREEFIVGSVLEI